MFKDVRKQFVQRWKAADVLLIGIFALYLMAGTIFNVVMPLGEAPDEPAHFNYVRYVAREGSLPVMAPRYEDNETVEAFQPPLYYVLVAPIMRPFVDDSVHILYNPAFRFGLSVPAFLDHPEHSFPWRGGDLAWHLLRFFSLIIGAITLWVVYRTGLLVFESRWLALAAVAYLALNPQYVYLHSSVTNDVLATLIGNLLTLSALWLLHKPTVKRFAVAASVVSLAALTKSSTLTLVPGLLVAAWLAWRKLPSARARWVSLGLLIFIPLGCSGWWFLRNRSLYGDFLGLAVAKEAMPANYYATSLTLGALLRRIPAMFWQSFKSSWGYFGWLSIPLPNGVFGLILLLHLLALVGLLFAIKRPECRRSSTLVLAATVLGALAGFLLYARDVNSSGWHGRFLFPAASVLAVGFVAGWRRWSGGQERLLATLSVGGGVVLMVGSLFSTVFPMYLPPRFMSAGEAVPNPINAAFGDDLQLVGYEVVSPDVEPGGVVEITLYWMLTETTRENYRFFVSGYTQRGVPIVARSESGLSRRYPTMQWPENKIVADRYRLHATLEREQVVGQLHVEVLSGYNDPEFVGEPVGLGQIVVRSDVESQTEEADVLAQFDDGILLTGYSLAPETIRAGECLSVTLHWEVVRPPSQNYQVFVHLFDEEGTRLAQHDGPPRDGVYPTSFWRAEESIPDVHTLVIPPEHRGATQVMVGLYALDTMARLPATGPDGVPYPNGAVPITSFSVEQRED